MTKMMKLLPNALRKQAVIRLMAGVSGIVMFVLIMIFMKEWVFAIPCAAAGVYFLISTFDLCVQYADGRIVIFRGECTDLERTLVRKRIKAIYIRNGEVQLQIVHPTVNVRSIRPGDFLVIYMAADTPVYEKDGFQVVCRILALEREVNGHENGRDPSHIG